jgi:hypothetical protein
MSERPGLQELDGDPCADDGIEHVLERLHSKSRLARVRDRKGVFRTRYPIVKEVDYFVPDVSELCTPIDREVRWPI